MRRNRLDKWPCLCFILGQISHGHLINNHWKSNAHMARGGKRPGAGRPKGAQTRLTVQTRALLWDYIEQQSTPAKSCNPFIRAVDLLRDSDDPAIIMRCIDFLGDRLLPKLKAIEVDLGETTQQVILHRYGVADAARNGDRTPA